MTKKAPELHKIVSASVRASHDYKESETEKEREREPIKVSHLARWLGVPVCICQGSSHGLWACKALLLSDYPLCVQFNKADYKGMENEPPNTVRLQTGWGSGIKTGAQLQIQNMNKRSTNSNLTASD